MDLAFDEIFRRIVEIAPGLHGAGTFSSRALEAIARAGQSRRIRRSVETGSGASTLVLSHLSEHHTAFALDAGSGSIANVRRSPLLRANTVTFVEGPTQATLPRHHFEEKLQLVLIDGPHGYPFPDLEYYFLYPHLETGAALIVDDIHIPTVHNLYRFLCRDEMFHLDQVVDTTAFFSRTDAPAFNPFGDDWWTQKYNSRLLLRYTWRARLKRILRGGVSSRHVARFGNRVALVTPANGAPVGRSVTATGTATLPPDAHLWLLVRRKDLEGWWPQAGGPALVEAGRWSVSVDFGTPADVGFNFEIAALIVGPATHDLWTDWVARVKATGRSAPVRLPAAPFLRAAAFRSVRKSE